MPKVSVIIPVHNTERYLPACLDSVIGQTLQDIEILCVDDGSTDGSLGILNEYADRDARIRVLAQPKTGAGASRNAGLRAAAGEYVAFWDSDDVFHAEALDAACGPCDLHAADVIIFRGQVLDMHRQRIVPAGWMVKPEYVPSMCPFSRKDRPQHIFGISVTCAWNKLFRRSFVIEKRLEFQNTGRANDLLFVYLALAEADRVAYLDRVLVTYRVAGRRQKRRYKYEMTLDHYHAYRDLKLELTRRGLFADVERSFVNVALRHLLWNIEANLHLPQLCTGTTHVSLRRYYNILRGEAFALLGIEGKEAGYFFRPDDVAEYEKIARHSWSGYVFGFLKASAERKCRMLAQKGASAWQRSPAERAK